MIDYISAPIPTNPDELLQDAYDYLTSVIPGWEPADGNLDVWLAQAFSQIAAQVAETASDVPTTIFRYFGTLVGVPPIDASPAAGAATITAIDTVGHTIPANTVVVLDPNGLAVPFYTLADAVIPAASSSIAGVTIVANDGGADGTGLSGTAQLVDALDYVLSVTVPAPTTGGTDAEDDTVYLDRLAGELQLLTPRPILPTDFSVLAQTVAGVDRATTLDGYNPADLSSGNERMVAVGVIDSAGNAVSGGVKTAVDALLQSLREVTFVVNVVDATYTTINVTFTAHAWTGADTAAVQAAAIAAVQDFLSPANWGQPTTGRARQWINDPVVRYLELAQAINQVEGLRYLDSLRLQPTNTTGNTTNASATVTTIPTTAGMVVGMPVTGSGIPAGTVIKDVPSGTSLTLSANATATASGVALVIGGDRDVTLTGAIPLPRAGTVTGTVS